MLLKKVVIMHLLMQAMFQPILQHSVNGLHGDPASLIVVRIQFDHGQEPVIQNIVLVKLQKWSLAPLQNAQQISMNVLQMTKEPNGDH